MSYGINKLENVIKTLKSFDYTDLELLKIIETFPNIFGLSNDSIVRRIVLLNKLGLNNIILSDTKQLIQSPELTFARYQCLVSNGIDVSMSTYRRIFIGNSQFERTYNLSKEQLLKMYKYEGEMNYGLFRL